MKLDNGKDKIYLKDAWVVITLGLFLFIIPAENPFRGGWRFKPPAGMPFVHFFLFCNVLTCDTRLISIFSEELRAASVGYNPTSAISSVV